MRNLRNFTVATSVIVLCQSLAASPVFAQAQPAPTQATETRPESSEAVSSDAGDIIVTANKRAESILNVAGAINAFRGDDLLKNGNTSLADLAGQTPGLQFNAGYGTGSPVIRGINTGADFGQSVGITVDGAPVGPSSSFQTGGASSLDLDPIDLERVEILKGPQGTVYGANTLAGLISYSLREPDLQKPNAIARMGLSGTEGGGTSHSERAALSIPIIEDQLAVRLSGFHDRRAGFIDNGLTNVADQNRWRNYGVQGSVLFKPVDRLRLFIAGIYQRQNQYVQDQVVYAANRTPRDGDLVNNDYLVPNTNRKTRFAVGKIDYDLDFANLTSVTSYQHLNVNYAFPQETGALNTIFVNILPLLGGVTIPAPGLLSNDTLNDFRKFTQEVRLTSTGSGPVSWLVGGYYTHERSEQRQSVNARTTSGALVPGINPALLVTIPTTLTEYSGFGNVTYAFSDAFDITGGLRIGRIEQANRTLLSGSNFAAYKMLFVVSGLGSGPPADTGPQKGAKTVATYLATARYHFSRDGMIFARFATGFRPGGPNFPVPGFDPVYNPDQTYNYELGLKTKFWGGRGSFDVTGYYLEWKNFLAFASAGGLNGFANAGDARVYGFEAGATLRPVDGLSLSGTLAFSDSKITRITSPAGIAKVGDTLPNNPRWSGSLSTEYRAPVESRWQAVVRGSARFAGARNSSPQSSVAFPNYVLPGYALFDAHAGLESAHVDIDLFVRNLTDKRAQLAAYTQLGVNQITVQQPRTIGVAVTFKY
ncbi:TonB-dependent receptor [Sphingomonas sp. ERG5]|uniref:TonB-dependent receptor n=1 Tax=Sphingomonas sp. ERG5 TaxID=1381597 RepID=UPI001364B83B|nr:TonB-dependent receptor [Sphingomonas sp. ERG5]